MQTRSYRRTIVTLTAIAAITWGVATATATAPKAPTDPALALSIVPHAVEGVSFTAFALPASPEPDGSHYYAVYLAIDATNSAADVESAGAVVGPGIQAGLNSYKMHGLFGPKPEPSVVQYTVAGAPLLEIELQANE